MEIFQVIIDKWNQITISSFLKRDVADIHMVANHFHSLIVLYKFVKTLISCKIKKFCRSGQSKLVYVTLLVKMSEKSLYHKDIFCQINVHRKLNEARKYILLLLYFTSVKIGVTSWDVQYLMVQSKIGRERKKENTHFLHVLSPSDCKSFKINLSQIPSVQLTTIISTNFYFHPPKNLLPFN